MDRSIPAWAGETLGKPTDLPNKQVYPRVGGGNLDILMRVNWSEGLSPRGRGKLHSVVSYTVFARSIPAWAGETPARVGSHAVQRVYPRVGGGNLSIAFVCIGLSGLSPRGRGKLRVLCRRRHSSGSIPAWAGETGNTIETSAQIAVYPRVGGGNGTSFRSWATTFGLSPRGRGKPKSQPKPSTPKRSIPAWAGETIFGVC